MAKNITPNQQEWKKELKRLNQFIKRAEKRGYIFDENIIPETPQRITKKKLSEIKQIDADVLYDTAKYFDIKKDEAAKIVDGIKQNIRHWKAVAEKVGISRSNMMRMENCFKF